MQHEHKHESKADSCNRDQPRISPSESAVASTLATLMGRHLARLSTLTHIGFPGAACGNDLAPLQNGIMRTRGTPAHDRSQSSLTSSRPLISARSMLTVLTARRNALLSQKRFSSCQGGKVLLLWLFPTLQIAREYKELESSIWGC